MDYAYYNGDYLQYDSIKIPLSDRSIYFGDGVYDCMIGRDGLVYQFDEHIARFKRNSSLIFLPLRHSESELLSIVKKLIKLSSFDQYTVYIQASRVSQRRAHVSEHFENYSLLITVTELEIPTNLESVDLISLEDVRYKMCHLKTLNLLPSVLAAHEAAVAGCDEAVFVRDGIVTECSRSNIFAIISGKIVTHPESRNILPGITRQNVLKAAKSLGLKYEERCFTIDELLESDGAFITSTTKFLREVKNVDNSPLSDEANHVIKLLGSQIMDDYLNFCC